MAVISPEVYTRMGLSGDEYARVLELLGRAPTLTELGMFAVMWSEHCGYKFSRPVLALFRRYREASEGAGLENAGVVEIGDGLGVTLKVESHNHPSAVEPYQGAATGVGGIIRDILTMGARPIAGLNSLRFGPIRSGEAPDGVVARNRYLFEHVVAGIAGYGNCVGVPTVGGEVGFDPGYSGNPLVNAMCVGLLRLDEVTTAAAAGIGNPVVYLGSATGKDGIHGATFASETLGEDNLEKRPNVQIGDPFAGKLLIEATLEALATGAVVAIQDMGAAGLTCSTVEMASKGRVGMSVDLDRVPMREADMSAYELMLSESQERMLAVVAKGREEEVLSVFRRWGLRAEVVGEVTGDGLLNVRRNGRVEASLDPRLLTDACPVYQVAAAPPPAFEAAARFDPEALPPCEPHSALRTLLGAPEIASKRWVYEQFDQQVQIQTDLGPGRADAAVLAPRGTSKGIALALDGNSRQTSAHAYRGGMLAVAEAARNVACVGARPRAITDGLNFGDPTDPVVFWQFREAVRGIADAAEALDTPVVSGNVSFYNESELGAAPPTPVIGMLGVLDHAERRVGVAPPVGALLFLLSVPVDAPHGGLGASAYLAHVLGLQEGYPEAPDLAGERALAETLARAAERRLIHSAHDASEGGLAVALAEIAIAGEGRVRAKAPGAGGVATRLFGEIPGQVIVSTADAAPLAEFAGVAGLALEPLGEVAPGAGLEIEIDGELLVWSDAELRKSYERAIPDAIDAKG